MRSISVFGLLLWPFFFLSCQSGKEKEVAVDPDQPTYFSINGYIRDQWAIYRGQPFGMTKYTYLNGQSDSLYTNALDMPWGPILQAFIESDISDPKFLGGYRFSTFEDDLTFTRSFYYEAIDPDLRTRKLQIMVDPFSSKIKSIFIETQVETFWTSKNQKLFYLPLKLIRIHETEDHFPGPPKSFRVEYWFL